MEYPSCGKPMEKGYLVGSHLLWKKNLSALVRGEFLTSTSVPGLRAARIEAHLCRSCKILKYYG
ncbi:MAG: PF20097 family protein [Promethearchaeota archaeon]